MKKGQDIVKMGNDVNRATEEFRSELPSDVASTASPTKAGW